MMLAIATRNATSLRTVVRRLVDKSYPVWIRTRNESTKNSSVTSYTTG